MRAAAKSRSYATLLLKLADERDALEAVYRSMQAFYAQYRKEPTLKAFLASTRMSGVEKIDLLARVYPDLHPINQAFIAQLGEERDMKLLGSIIKYLELVFYAKSDQVKVHAVTTAPLSTDTVSRIQTVVRSVTSKKADFSSEVNSAILGGLTLRVGNTILDGSLSGKLARIRQALVQS